MKVAGKQNYGSGYFYYLPDDLAEEKYLGCGNGQVIIDKSLDEPVDMDYLDEDDEIIYEQNISMSINAGEIMEETEKYIIYRCNFSCGTACLF